MDPRQFPAPAAATTAPSLAGHVDVAAMAWSDCGSLALALLQQVCLLRRKNQRLRFDLAQLRGYRYAGAVPDRWGCPTAPGALVEDD